MLPEPLRTLVLAAVAFIAATIAAITGFGGAAILLPVLVVAFGVREAVPILTVAQLIGNGSRVWFNRRALDWKVVTYFAVGGVPCAFIGGLIFSRAPGALLTQVLGAFLIMIVIARRIVRDFTWRPSLPMFAFIGAGASFLSALMGSIGPLMAPFFLAYGLTKSAYIGTEALTTVIMHVTKLIAYKQSSVLPLHAVAVGLAMGPLMIGGSYVGKRIVDRLPERVFVSLIEVTLVVAGILFLAKK